MGAGGISGTTGWLSAVGNLLFPPSCTVCSCLVSGGDQGICNNCLGDIEYIKSPCCSVCGCEMADSTAGDHLCGDCLRVHPPYIVARAVVRYQEPFATLLHSLKYGGDLTVLPPLERLIRAGKINHLTSDEWIIPVPLHLNRLRQRGFNQAVLLAALFYPNDKKRILVSLLRRIRHTDPQTGLDGIARRKNLRHAFTVTSAEKLQGRPILLIDDVYTTGSTVSECSRVLLEAGAKSVKVLTLARVQ